MKLSSFRPEQLTRTSQCLLKEILLLGFGLVYSVPQTENRNEKKVNGNLKSLLKDPQMICFLVSCFLDCLGSYSVFAYTSVMPLEY